MKLTHLAWLLPTLLAAGLTLSSFGGSAVVHADAAPAAPKAEAVEPDMHEFMEYVFQPPYKRLKAGMAAEPADNAGWKVLKAEGLSLAEAANLLLIREADDDQAAWNEISVSVRESGKQLYQAAKKKDYKAARASYETMLKRCNACHDKYAGGEHQLSP